LIHLFKEKIRLLSTRKDIREHLEQHYGKDALHQMIEEEKAEYMERKQIKNELSDELSKMRPNYRYIIETLAEYDMSPNEIHAKNQTLLGRICHDNNLTVFKKLLKFEEIDLDIQDEEGRTPLIRACECTDTIVEASNHRSSIFGNGDDNDYDYDDHLEKNIEIIKLLLKKGADADIIDTHGYRAIDYLPERKRDCPDEIINAFEKRGITIYDSDDEDSDDEDDDYYDD
jgi:ankyrin repeat protein